MTIGQRLINAKDVAGSAAWRLNNSANISAVQQV